MALNILFCADSLTQRHPLTQRLWSYDLMALYKYAYYYYYYYSDTNWKLI